MRAAIGGAVVPSHVDCGEQSAAGADELERRANLSEVAVRVGPVVIEGHRCVDHPVPGADAAAERTRPVRRDGAGSPAVRSAPADIRAGRSVGPARGSFKVPLDHVLVVHDEIDLPFGDIRTRVGGGLAGHNGLKSLKAELGSGDFSRVRVGVSRPDSTDPEVVAAYVLGRFRQSPAEVCDLIDAGAAAVEGIVLDGDGDDAQGR